MFTSIILPVKGRLSHLKECLPRVLAQEGVELEVVVSDYNCPDGTKRFLSEHYPNVKCEKVPVQAGEWNLAAARNAGYKAASKDSELLLFLDADALMEPGFLANVIRNVYHAGAFVCGWGASDATGCCLVQRAAFEKVRGYNEALQGWGMDDIDFYNRLEAAGFERRVWPEDISTIKHSDEMRVTFQNNKDMWATNILNGEIAKREFRGI